MNSDLLISLLGFQTSKSPESCMAMKEDALGASLMDGKLTTQLLLTDNEHGSALEKQDGKPSTKKPDCSGLFRSSFEIKSLVLDVYSSLFYSTRRCLTDQFFG